MTVGMAVMMTVRAMRMAVAVTLESGLRHFVVMLHYNITLVYRGRGTFSRLDGRHPPASEGESSSSRDTAVGSLRTGRGSPPASRRAFGPQLKTRTSARPPNRPAMEMPTEPSTYNAASPGAPRS